MKAIKYGGIDLIVINSDDTLVPADCQKIEFPQEDKKALALSVRDNKPCLLVGETGTGKTSAIRELAYLRKQAYVRVNMTGFTTPDELIGSKAVKDGATYFEYGIITDAMKRGAILVIDEINATTPDCLFILHGLLDEDRQITLPTGEVVKPHVDFRVFATCNPDYEGTKSMNKAFIDRFPIIIEVNVLNPKREKELLVKRIGISDDLADKMVAVATMVRKDYLDQKVTTYISTRTLLNWAWLVNSGVDEKAGFITTIAKKTSIREEQKVLVDFFSAVFKMAVNNNDDATPTITTKGEMRIFTQQRDKYNRVLEELTAREKIEVAELQIFKERTSTLEKIVDIKDTELMKKTKLIGELQANIETYKRLDGFIKNIADGYNKKDEDHHESE